MGRSTCRLLDHCQRDVALFYHLARYFEFFHFLLAGQAVHQLQHELFQNHTQAASAYFTDHRLARNRAIGVVAELQAHVFEFKQTLVLLDDGILGSRQDFYQRVFIQVLQDAHHGQAADELGYQAELDQILRLRFGDQFKIVLGRCADCLFVGFASRAEAQGLLAHTARDDFFQTYEGAAANEKNIRSIDGREFLMRMLAPALGRNIGDRPLQYLQQRLLHALTGHVAGDRRVLVLAADLVNLIYIDDAGLRSTHIAFGGLEKLENDVFDIFAYIASLGERSGVDDCEGHIQHAGESLREQRLARPGWADQQNVGFGQFHAIAGALAVHVDALVVVVDGDGQFLLGLLLSDDVLVEEGLDVLRLRQLVGNGCCRSRRPIVFQDRIADGNALVADVCPGIVAWGRDQFGDCVLRFVAERTAQYLIRARSGFHSDCLLIPVFLPP